MARNTFPQDAVQSGDVVKLLHERVERLLATQARTPEERKVIAVAGVPGSGKSTVTAALLKSLKLSGATGVVVLGMVSV